MQVIGANAFAVTLATPEGARRSIQVLSTLMAGLLVAGMLSVVHAATATDPLQLRSSRDLSASATEAQSAVHPAESGVLDTYGSLPPTFVPNAGQTDARVRYQASGYGYNFFFTEHKAVLSLSKPSERLALDLRFLGANPRPRIIPEDPQKGHVNYLTGSDRAEWATGVPTYGSILYRSLWPGIDMRFRGVSGQLKYEFVVHPGASPADIGLAYAGADRLTVDGAGALSIHTPAGVLRDARPTSYQRGAGHEVPIPSRYVLGDGTTYGFAVGSYNSRLPLVIDPGLDYATFIGGTAQEEAFGVALNGGKAFVTGSTQSSEYPTTPGAFDATQSSDEAFVTQLNDKGSALVYSTFLGGALSDVGEDIFIDRGEAYVTGETESADFPTTPGVVANCNGGVDDAFVTRLNKTGSALVYSTCLGGTAIDQGRGIHVYHGNAYVAGVTFSPDFPTTPGAFDNTYNINDDAFVTKLNPTGTALEYSTFLGGFFSDVGRDIAVEDGQAYVTGYTDSSGLGPTFGFPSTPGAFDDRGHPGREVFVTKFNRAGSGLVYSTFLGGEMFDEGFAIAVESGEAYVTGVTQSADFPIIAGSFENTLRGIEDAFVTKLNTAGSHLVYSTYLGGNGSDIAEGIDVQGGKAYVAGNTNSNNFPVTANAFDQTFNGGTRDAFLTSLNGNGSALDYSTYLGGNARDQARNVAVSSRHAFVTGFTSSADFPVTPGAYDTTQNGGRDVFVAKVQT